MEISHSRMYLSILRGMLGRITPNLRYITVKYSSEYIFLNLYYQNQLSEEEDELAEELATEVISDFPDIALNSFELNKKTLPYPLKVPVDESIVFHKYESNPN